MKINEKIFNFCIKTNLIWEQLKQHISKELKIRTLEFRKKLQIFEKTFLDIALQNISFFGFDRFHLT